MMWPQSFSIMFVAVGLSLFCLWPSHAQGARRFDCRRFCMRTGFRGTVGGCRCQFTLFTNKRGLPSDYSESRLAKRAFPPLMEEHLDELPQFSDLTTADILALSQQVPAARAKLLYPYLAGLQDGADYQDNYSISDIISSALANEDPPSDNVAATNNADSTFDVTPLTNQITEPKSTLTGSTNNAVAAVKAENLPEQNQLMISRKELKQQLENGNDSDYIRLSFQ